MRKELFVIFFSYVWRLCTPFTVHCPFGGFEYNFNNNIFFNHAAFAKHQIDTIRTIFPKTT